MIRTLLPALAFVLLFGLTRADEPTSPDFSHFPQTPAYEEAFSAGLRDDYILSISAFAGSGGFVLFYSVNQNGQESDVREVPDFAMEDSHGKKLSGDEMKSLMTAIADLPSVNDYASADRLVIVRTRKGNSTITHCYDGNHLPKAVHDIYAVIGERFETAGIK